MAEPIRWFVERREALKRRSTDRRFCFWMEKPGMWTLYEHGAYRDRGTWAQVMATAQRRVADTKKL